MLWELEDILEKLDYKRKSKAKDYITEMLCNVS
jgi:hypothetical protein